MRLLERGPALLGAADELWRSVGRYGTGERGGVTVAYGASASYETAPRLLQALAESHPGIKMTTAVKSVHEIVVRLRNGSVDWVSSVVLRSSPGWMRGGYGWSARAC